MKTPTPGLFSLLACAVLLPAASGHSQVLFADTFDRANNADLNASADGKSGTLGALTWTTVISPANTVVDILNNQLRINSGDSNGNNGGLAYISDHNFVDADIKTAGTFTVTMDITAQSSGGNGRYAGFRVGQTLANLTGETNAAVSGNVADVGIYLDAVGANRGIRVYEAGTNLGDVYSNASQGPAEMSATFTFADMNAGTTLNYEVFLDGVSRYVGSTTWSGTDENYISLQSNSTNNTLINSFEVEIPVVDVTGPVLNATNPADDATEIPISSNLVATFDEAIALGATGSVTIRNLTNPADVVIDVSGSDPDGTLGTLGFDLTIDPAVDLVPGDEYVIEITGDAIEDLSGNVYLGLLETDSPNWSFTADDIPPVLTATDPADDATNITTTTNLVATFDEDILLGATGSVTIRNLTNPGDTVIDLPGPDPDGTLAVSGTELTIDPAADLTPGDEYVIEITGDAVTDISGNLFDSLFETDEPNWSFTTDGTAPMVSGFGPMTGATDVLATSNLSLTLDEDALLGTGNITIHLAGDDSVVATIDVNSGLVTISGGTITIDPAAALADTTAYYVNIEAGAITDLSGNAYAGITDTSTWAFTTVTPDPAVLFADNFNRPDNADINATTAGQAGTLAPLTYGEATSNGSAIISNNQLRLRENGGGGAGWHIVFLQDHNFIDPVIASGGGFTVSIDINEASLSGGNGRTMSVGVGQALAEVSGATSRNGPADILVGYDNIGATKGIFIDDNDSAAVTLPFPSGIPSLPDTILIDYSFSDFNAGSTVNYEVFIDGVSFHTGSATWSGADENYISIHSNYASENSKFDNLEIRSKAVMLDPLTLDISSSGGALDFSWNSTAGMQYDLVSSTSLTTDPATWTPYNDGSTTYENLLASSLTGVAITDPTRFFAILEEPVQAIYSEDFDGGDGSYTATGTPNDWAHGVPNSDNSFGFAVNTANGGAGSCWATTLGAGGTPSGVIDPAANSILRSPNIDLTGVSGAELTFAAAVDSATGDTIEVLVREVGTDNLLDTITPITTPATAAWADLGPFDLSAGAGSNVYLEFRFQGTDGTYIGLYLDDVVVTPTAP